MTKLVKMTILLLATASFVLNINGVQPQSNKESLRPDATISETMAWLKSHIAYGYNYSVPAEGNGDVYRWTLGGVHSKDCKLSYDITVQTMSSTSNDHFKRQFWEVDLAGLNPRILVLQPATKEKPVRIELTAVDPTDPDLIRRAQANGGWAIVEVKAIKQRYRIDNYYTRESYEPRARFFTQNEERARELAAALRRGIELCRQTARRN